MEINRRVRNSYFGAIPPQAISSSKKNKKHYEETMDALEYIGELQYIDNAKYEDVLRMIAGRQSVKEARELLPYLKNVTPDMLEEHIPSYIRHYDLIGQIINAVKETYMLTRDDYFISSTDEISTNEFIRTRSMLMQNYLQQSFSKELDMLLQAQGYEVDLSLVQFSSEEEQVEYSDFLERMRQELTPEGIDLYMKDTYKVAAVRWGEGILDNDFTRFNEEELIRENLTEFLAAGKCFRHYRVGHDFYEPEVWRLRETFYSKESNTRYANRREYIGRILFLTASQLINRYAEKLPAKTSEKLQSRMYEEPNNSLLPPELTTPFNSDKRMLMPSSDYLERQVTKNLEDVFKIPLTSLLVQDDCNVRAVPGFSSSTFTGLPGHPIDLYSAARFHNNGELRQDVFQVTEAYFTDYQKMGLLCLENEYGIKVFEYVTDDLLADFISELGITQIQAKSLEEMERNPEANTVTWFYKQYSRKGLKINLDNIGEKSFYHTEKTPYQIYSHSNMFETMHPVAGYIGSGIGDKLENTQALYNMAMNQLQDIAEKEVGVIFLFDQAFLRSDNKEDGQSSEAMEMAMSIAKSLGYLGINTSSDGFASAMSSGQFHPINLSMTENMQSRMQLALYYKQQAYDLIGVRLGQAAPPDAYKTAEGIRIDREAMYAQLEHYYSQFSDFLRESYNIHLAVAQFCQKNNKDITLQYSKSDGEQVFLQFTDDNFALRKLGVNITTNAKQRKQQEQMKQYLLSNNTMIEDPLIFASILTSDNMTTMLAAAKQHGIKQQAQQQQSQQHAMQQIQAQSEAAKDQEYFSWYLEETSKQRDRENKIQLEGIEAMGRALYRNAGTENADVINDQVRQSLQQQKIEGELADKQVKNDIRVNESQQRLAYQERALDQRDRELDLKERKLETDKFIATVNKN